VATPRLTYWHVLLQTLIAIAWSHKETLILVKTVARSSGAHTTEVVSRATKFRAIARTGFFVLYSVFKERSVERARWPELD